MINSSACIVISHAIVATASLLALSSLVSAFQGCNVEFLHLKEGLCYPRYFLPVPVLQQLGQDGGDDLPRHAVLVIEPAALVRLAALGEFFPKTIDLFPSFAADDEGYCGRELEYWSSV